MADKPKEKRLIIKGEINIMQEVQRFNKVLKSFVLFGDILLALSIILCK